MKSWIKPLAGFAVAQSILDRALYAASRTTEQHPVVVLEVVQLPGEGDHPLVHRHQREQVLGQAGGRRPSLRRYSSRR